MKTLYQSHYLCFNTQYDTPKCFPRHNGFMSSAGPIEELPYFQSHKHVGLRMLKV